MQASKWLFYLFIHLLSNCWSINSRHETRANPTKHRTHGITQMGCEGISDRHSYLTGNLETPICLSRYLGPAGLGMRTQTQGVESHHSESRVYMFSLCCTCFFPGFQGHGVKWTSVSKYPTVCDFVYACAILCRNRAHVIGIMYSDYGNEVLNQVIRVNQIPVIFLRITILKDYIVNLPIWTWIDLLIQGPLSLHLCKHNNYG